MPASRALLLAVPLLTTVTLAACGSGAAASGSAPPPTVAASPIPAPPVPTPTIGVPTIAVPTIGAPTFDPTVSVPDAPFPEVKFPEVAFPEISLPDITVQQGDDDGRPTTVYTVPGDVLFDFDKSDIRPDADEALRQVSASLATRAPTAHLEIRGHTDSMGDDAYNLALSERRAHAVEGWLSTRGGVDASRMEARGFGESQPVAPNTHPDGSDDPAGRQRNRRVEIVAR